MKRTLKMSTIALGFIVVSSQAYSLDTDYFLDEISDCRTESNPSDCTLDIMEELVLDISSGSQDPLRASMTSGECVTPSGTFIGVVPKVIRGKIINTQGVISNYFQTNHSSSLEDCQWNLERIFNRIQFRAQRTNTTKSYMFCDENVGFFLDLTYVGTGSLGISGSFDSRTTRFSDREACRRQASQLLRN